MRNGADRSPTTEPSAVQNGSEPCRGFSDPLHAMHTAEHILSAVMQREFGTGRSLETHLGAKKSKCDYRVDRALQEHDLHGIESAVNAEIEKDHRVSSFEIGREEAEGRYDMGKVPEGAKTIRIVRIGDLDAMPCVGAHVERTGQVGRFVIRSWTMKTPEVIRVRYSVRPEAH